MVAILGFCLPVAIIVCLIIGLSIRRCVSCSGGRCISSFCKEEMVLALLTLPYSAAYLTMYLPLLDQNLDMLNAQPAPVWFAGVPHPRASQGSRDVHVLDAALVVVHHLAHVQAVLIRA